MGRPLDLKTGCKQTLPHARPLLYRQPRPVPPRGVLIHASLPLRAAAAHPGAVPKGPGAAPCSGSADSPPPPPRAARAAAPRRAGLSRRVLPRVPGRSARQVAGPGPRRPHEASAARLRCGLGAGASSSPGPGGPRLTWPQAGPPQPPLRLGLRRARPRSAAPAPDAGRREPRRGLRGDARTAPAPPAIRQKRAGGARPRRRATPAGPRPRVPKGASTPAGPPLQGATLAQGRPLARRRGRCGGPAPPSASPAVLPLPCRPRPAPPARPASPPPPPAGGDAAREW